MKFHSANADQFGSHGHECCGRVKRVRYGHAWLPSSQSLVSVRGAVTDNSVRGCDQVKLRLFRRRNLFRVALTVLLAFLLQQVAIAGYACPLTQMPAPQQAMMDDCEGMEMEDSAMLCKKHCNPDNSANPELRVGSVPPSALPALRFDLPVALISGSSAQRYEDVPVCQSDPPPQLRFCSLQI